MARHALRETESEIRIVLRHWPGNVAPRAAIVIVDLSPIATALLHHRDGCVANDGRGAPVFCHVGAGNHVRHGEGTAEGGVRCDRCHDVFRSRG